MKVPRPFPLLVAILAAGTLNLSAQPESQPDTADDNRVVPQWQMDFENLPPTTKALYRKRLFEASRLFRQKRIIETLNEIAEAQKLFDQGPAALNLLGACHVEFRNFERARKAFEDALALQAKFLEGIETVQGEARLQRMRAVVNILFNLAEMDFVTGKWQSCHDRLAKLIPELDPEDISMGRLIEFKFLLCKLKVNQVDAARQLSLKYDYQDDNPFYYYANAAMCYHDGKLAEAERWRATARKVFRRATILAPWEDTMIEFGFVQSFYGGNLEGAD